MFLLAGIGLSASAIVNEYSGDNQCRFKWAHIYFATIRTENVSAWDRTIWLLLLYFDIYLLQQLKPSALIKNLFFHRDHIMKVFITS